MVKPWHAAFKPSTETFNILPIWVHLPNLPLRFWINSCFEAIGNSLGVFLVVDKDTSDFSHTTCAQILVDLDISKDLTANITLKVAGQSWSQLLDYEGIPFCY